jgi:hypothetical protein
VLSAKLTIKRVSLNSDYRPAPVSLRSNFDW